MHVITIANMKGGVGKTTLSLLLATELALEGYRVAMLDCDFNQHGAAFAEKASIKNFSVIGNVDEDTVLPTLRDAKASHDLVVIDLPGVSSTLALKAFQRSTLVLIPSRPSLPDLRDAIRTNTQVNDAEDLRGSPIRRSIVWTQIAPGFESRASRHVRAALEGRGVPVLSLGLMDRVAFREMHITGQVPRQNDPTGSPAGNVTALTSAILAELTPVREAAL
jgi:chromosome partitioning protein